jgi:hypothetical protein
MIKDHECLRPAQVIRPIDLGGTVQLLCEDEGGLLSVYFEAGQFENFLNYLYKSRIELGGLLIQFDRDRVFVPRRGKVFNRQAVRRKALFA